MASRNCTRRWVWPQTSWDICWCVKMNYSSIQDGQKMFSFPFYLFFLFNYIITNLTSSFSWPFRVRVASYVRASWPIDASTKLIVNGRARAHSTDASDQRQGDVCVRVPSSCMASQGPRFRRSWCVLWFRWLIGLYWTPYEGYAGFHPPRPQDEDVMSQTNVKNGFVVGESVPVNSIFNYLRDFPAYEFWA